MEYIKDSDFTFENEKCLNEDLQNLVNGNKVHLMEVKKSLSSTNR
jgi:hypothetical protein